MSYRLKVILAVIPVSALLGVAWGLWTVENKRFREFGRRDLHVLAETRFFPPQVIEDFEKQYNAHVVLYEANTDLDLLNEAQTPPEALDVIQLRSYHAPHLAKADLLKAWDPHRLKNFSNISVDFRTLRFGSDSAYFVPFQWGINGFLVRRQSLSFSEFELNKWLRESNKTRLAVMASPVETLALLERQNLPVNDWINNQKSEALVKALRETANSVTVAKESADQSLAQPQIAAAQVESGKAARLVRELDDVDYVIPKDKATLWVALLAKSKTSREPALADKFVDFLLTSAIAAKMIEANEHATALASLDGSAFDDKQKASYIRSVDLHRMQLVLETKAFQPVWLKALASVYPELFGPSAKDQEGRSF